MSETNLIFIAEFLQRAWDDLLQDHQTTFSSNKEIEVNTLMETRLNALLDKEEFWSQLVRCVAGGKNTLSYDGSHLEKKPDLSVYLTDQRRSFPLAIECKLLDAPSKKTVNLYCNDGIIRFVQGEYGWAAREAFMLAYVRDGSTIDLCLKPFLAGSRARQTDLYLTEALPELADHPTMHLARSSHSRKFLYIGQSQNHPGPIAVWHLWVST